MAWNKPSTWFAKTGQPAPTGLLPAASNNQPYAVPNPPTPDNPNSVPLDVPIGTSGLRRAGGFVYEELLLVLSGTRAVRVYREMSDNSGIVGAVLYTVEMFLRQTEWRVEPNPSGTPRALQAAEFLDECFEDMDHTWDDFIAEVVTMLPYGWAYIEKIFKHRLGPNQTDDAKRSRFNDGRIGIRKLAQRSQDSLYRWEFDHQGNTKGMWQLDPWGGAQTVLIPSARALHFRTTSRKNNPQGRSVLRNAYRHWWFAKRLEDIEAIGIERDLTGLPKMELPPEMFAPNATPQQKAIVQNYLTLVQQVRRDEREGIVMPCETLPDGKASGYKFSLLGSGGRRAIDTSAPIIRHEQRIAMSMLAEFIFLGTQNVGSWSLASSKASLFAKTLGGHMENIAGTINRNLVPQVMGLNGFVAEEYPKVVYGDIETPDLADIASYINQLVGAAVLTPDDSIERKLREMANLPQLEKPPASRAKPGAPTAPGAQPSTDDKPPDPNAPPPKSPSVPKPKAPKPTKRPGPPTPKPDAAAAPQKSRKPIGRKTTFSAAPEDEGDDNTTATSG